MAESDVELYLQSFHLSPEVTEKIKLLPTEEDRLRALKETDIAWQYRNVDIDTANWIEEELTLNSFKERTSPLEFLNLKFMIEESRRERREKALNIKNKIDEIKSIEQKQMDDLFAKTTASQTKRDSMWLKWKLKFSSKGNPGYIVKSYTGGPPPTIPEEISTAQTYSSWWDGNTWKYKISIDELAKIEATIFRAALESGEIYRMWPFTFKTNPLLMKDILERCFPSARSYFVPGGKEAFPLAVDVMEKVPWPTASQWDFAFKKYTGWGTQKYAEGRMRQLYFITDQNIRESNKYWYTVRPPRRLDFTIMDHFMHWEKKVKKHHVGLMQPEARRFSESTAFMPDLNPDYDPIELYRRLNPEKDRTSYAMPYSKAQTMYESEKSWVDMLQEKGIDHPDTKALSKYRRDHGLNTWQTIYRRSSIYELPTDFWPKEAFPYKAHDSTALWYSPRPKEGFFYIPKFGNINPFLWPGTNVRKSLSPTGIAISAQEKRERERLRREADQRISEYWKSLENAIVKSETIDGLKRVANLVFTGDPNKPISEIAIKATWRMIGEGMKNATPWAVLDRNLRSDPLTAHLYRELDNLTGGLMSSMRRIADLPGKAVGGEPISDAELYEALELGLKIGMIILSGGTATAIIGTSSSQLKKGTLGKNPLGRAILAIGEATAVAAIANTSIEKAIATTIEREVKGFASKELAEEIDIGDEALEKVLAQAIIESGITQIKGQDGLLAFGQTAKEGAKTTALSKVPGGSLLYNTGSKIYEEGWDVGGVPAIDLSTIFKQIDWKAVGRETAKVVGAKDKEAALREVLRGNLIEALEKAQIEQNQISNLNEDQKKEASIREEINLFERKNQVIEKVGKGEIPSLDELRLLHPEADKFLNIIRKVVPEIQVGFALNMGLKIGLPKIDWGIAGIGDVFSVDVGFNLPSLPDLGFPSIDLGIPFDEEMIKTILIAILPILVPLTPLIPVRRGQPAIEYENTISHIDVDGNVNIRSALAFSPFDHAMLNFNIVPRRLSKKQKKHQLLRKIDIQEAILKLEKLKLQQAQTDIELSQMG